MHGILAHTGSCAVWKRIEARTRGRILRSLLDARPSASSFAWLGRVSRYNDPRPRLKSTKLAAYKGRRFRGVRVRAPSHRTPSISVFSLSLSLFLSLFLVFLYILSSSSLFFLLLFSFSLSLWLFKSILLLGSIIGGIEISFPSFFSFLSLSLRLFPSSDSIDRFARFLGITNYATNGSTAAGWVPQELQITRPDIGLSVYSVWRVSSGEKEREREREGSGAATVGLGKNE